MSHGTSPEGVYRQRIFEDTGFPANPLPYEDNGVQHTAKWNYYVDALNALRSLVTGVTAEAQAAFSYDALGELPVGPIAAPMTMEFDGTILAADLNTDIVGNLTMRILKNGVDITNANPLVITGADTVHDEVLTGWTLGFVEGDTLQVEVVSVLDCTSFVLSLKVHRI